MCAQNFFAFEGIDGSGKTSVIKKLSDYYSHQGLSVICLQEPGGVGLVGQQVRSLLKNPDLRLNALSELMLFYASRYQLFLKEIPEILSSSPNQKTLILLDRFFFSTYAYQGFARGLDLNLIRQLNSYIPLSMRPTMTFYLKIPLEISLKRRALRHQARGENNTDPFEQEDLEFYSKVIEGLDCAQKEYPLELEICDASQEFKAVLKHLKSRIDSYVFKK